MLPDLSSTSATSSGWRPRFDADERRRHAVVGRNEEAGASAVRFEGFEQSTSGEATT